MVLKTITAATVTNNKQIGAAVGSGFNLGKQLIDNGMAITTTTIVGNL